MYVLVVFLLIIALVMVVLVTPWLFSFLWKLPKILLLNHKENKGKPPHLYGIFGYVGDVGSGKTMCMVDDLMRLRKQYGDKIYITTNFFWKGQDFAFENYEQLLKIYDKPLVVAWDEVQNEFCSRDFQKFPVSLLTLLTQNRKGHGVRILWSAQRLSHIDKYFRDLTTTIYFAHTLLGRFSFRVALAQTDLTAQGKPKEYGIKLGKCRWFLQTDEHRNSYDSFQVLQSAQNRGYGDIHFMQEETPIAILKE